MAATMRLTPKPVVHVEVRPEPSATWRTYHERMKSPAFLLSSAVSSTGAPATFTRLNKGTQEAPRSPITHASIV